MKIEFKTDRIFLKLLRSDRSYRLELDCGEYEKEAMKQIMDLPEGVYRVEIIPDVEKK